MSEVNTTVQLNQGKNEGNTDQETKKKIKNTIIEIILALCRIFQTKDKEPYAAVPDRKIVEVHKLKSIGFARLLVRLVFEATKKIISGNAISNTIEYLSWLPTVERQKGENLYIRYAFVDGAIYIDTADPEIGLIKIKNGKWEIVDQTLHPPFFERPAGMQPLPRPVKGGSITELKQFINYGSEKNFIRIVGWIIGALNPLGPYSILVQHGPQGSGKSTNQKIIGSLIDPSEAGLTSIPKTARDLFISAINNWLLRFDNVSKISQTLSDCFCRLTNEGSFRTRKLYSDAQEVILKAMRPLMCNGISHFITQNDLIDRAIFVDLPTIKKSDRKPEKELHEAWEEARPRILGAFYDILAVALENYQKINTDNLPRTADFTRWVLAAEPACPWEPGDFIDAYNENRAEMIDLAIEADPTGESILKLMEDKTNWIGTSTELLEAIRLVTSKDNQKLKEWPKAPNTLSNRLMRLEGFLSSKGIKIARERQPNKRIIKLNKTVTGVEDKGQKSIMEMRERGDFSPVGAPATSKENIAESNVPTLIESDSDSIEDFSHVEPATIVEFHGTDVYEELEV